MFLRSYVYTSWQFICFEAYVNHKIAVHTSYIFLKIKTSEKEPGVAALIPWDGKLKLDLISNCYGHEIINFKQNKECISLIKCNFKETRIFQNIIELELLSELSRIKNILFCYLYPWYLSNR